MRTILLGGLISLALLGSGGVALAEEDPTTPPSSSPTSSSSTAPTSESSDPAPPAEPPEPEAPAAPQDNEEPEQPEEPSTPEEPPAVAPAGLNAGSGCGDGVGFVEVEVTNPNDAAIDYTVVLRDDDGKAVQERTVTVGAGETEAVGFGDVPAGEFTVVATGGGEEASEPVTVDRCQEIGPITDPLQVFVRCENGEGLVTIRVFNTEGDSRTFTVSIDDLQLPGQIELGTGTYSVVVDEVPTPDGTFVVRVVAEGIDHAETVNVACAPAPEPTPTTTTTPAPQARPAANTGGLASTGATVGGGVVLGLLALGLGGGLLIMSRRRRTRPSGETDA